jgi:hypothetical protein
MLAAPSSPYNRGLDEIRRASVSWERRAGPRRQVLDVVCLVPDLPTFLEAISAWDESHAFPILIDDVEMSFKFLRAFRPARIVRYPRRGAPVAAEQLWDAAVAAVRRSWMDEAAQRGGLGTGANSPGVVLSSPTSPMLAGAVALAAGRFQPLVRWECGKHDADLIPRDEAMDLALAVEAVVADRIASYSRLGDDCDFLTLACDGPYRYQDREGPGAFDDLVARSAGGGARWAFTGRLLGDATASVYRAMCSLFLQPESILLLNTYIGREQPWTEYALGRVSDHLAPFGAVTLREGDRASLADWWAIFTPSNRFGLVMLNTSGSPTDFNLPGGPGQTGDIPPSVPAAVLTIHSFSASAPFDPQTLAGRWLANGAFVYFGAMHEPFLQSFRPPQMVAGLIAEGLPLSAALRRAPPEPFGKPWRLVYLGDPLYQLQPRESRLPRLAHWERLAAWPSYHALPQPDARAPDEARLDWALTTALDLLQRGARPPEQLDLPAVLLAIDRQRLAVRLRPVYDALLVDTLLEANRLDDLLERLWRIRGTEGGSVVVRAREALAMSALAKRVAARDFSQAAVLWAQVVRNEPTPSFLQTFTDRIAALADTPARRSHWRGELQAAQRDLSERSPQAGVVGEALRRVEKQMAEQS